MKRFNEMTGSFDSQQGMKSLNESEEGIQFVMNKDASGEMQTEGAENKPALKDDEFFLSLMHQLYETPKVAVRDVIEPELSFEENDEGQKDQEKAEVVEMEIEEKAEEKEEAEANQASPQPTFLQRAMQWLSKLTTEES